MHLLVANQIARTLRLTFSLVKDIPESTLVSIGSRLVARRDRPLARRRDAARQPQQGARTQPSKNPAPVRVDHCGRFASRFWAAFAAPSALRDRKRVVSGKSVSERVELGGRRTT